MQAITVFLSVIISETLSFQAMNNINTVHLHSQLSLKKKKNSSAHKTYMYLHTDSMNSCFNSNINVKIHEEDDTNDNCISECIDGGSILNNQGTVNRDNLTIRALSSAQNLILNHT